MDGIHFGPYASLEVPRLETKGLNQELLRREFDSGLSEEAAQGSQAKGAQRPQGLGRGDLSGLLEPSVGLLDIA